MGTDPGLRSPDHLHVPRSAQPTPSSAALGATPSLAAQEDLACWSGSVQQEGISLLPDEGQVIVQAVPGIHLDQVDLVGELGRVGAAVVSGHGLVVATMHNEGGSGRGHRLTVEALEVELAGELIEITVKYRPAGSADSRVVKFQRTGN